MPPAPVFSLSLGSARIGKTARNSSSVSGSGSGSVSSSDSASSSGTVSASASGSGGGSGSASSWGTISDSSSASARDSRNGSNSSSDGRVNTDAVTEPILNNSSFAFHRTLNKSSSPGTVAAKNFLEEHSEMLYRYDITNSVYLSNI